MIVYRSFGSIPLGKSIVNHYSIAQGNGGQELGEWSNAGILTSGRKIEGEHRALLEGTVKTK
jgi:hypothetical protein